MPSSSARSSENKDRPTDFRGKALPIVSIRFDIGFDIIAGLLDYVDRHRVGISIFSVSGAVSGVSLRSAHDFLERIYTLRDSFQLIAFSCKILRPGAAPVQPITVSLVAPCGKVISGIVVGPLRVAEPVHLAVATFDPMDSHHDEAAHRAAVEVIGENECTTVQDVDFFNSFRVRNHVRHHRQRKK